MQFEYRPARPFDYWQIETILLFYVLVRRPIEYRKIWNVNFKKFGIQMVGRRFKDK